MKRFLCVITSCLLGACASGPPVDTTYASISHASRVQFLVLHHTVIDFPTSLRVLTKGPNSSHYLVGDNPPIIYRLVDESRQAFHAGVSSWKGSTSLNASSIGIEIVNLADQEGTPAAGTWAEYPKEQIDVVIELVKDIVRRHSIPPERVVGHSDIAPQRKVDPGPKFPWKRLADAGLIRWPDAVEVARRQVAFEQTLPEIAWFQQKLSQHGFAVPRSGELDAATRSVLIVFQMKYRPARFDGAPDAETAAILDVLVSP